MKKKLVVLLAVVMMFAFSASAYAATFSDVSERSVVEQDAIKKAVALGIIEGYEDGTFGPDKTITRAEFAKIAVTAAGAKDTATMLEANASSFKDVRANSWYTGWINAAESLGIFKGDQNGNFRPNDTISNQEAITVLMRLLGYNDNLTGSWPVNYVTKANQINILDDVNIVASAAAKRGDIVVMLSATLDTDIVTYDKDTNEFVKKQTTKSGSGYNNNFITLLEDSFEGAYLEVESFPAVTQIRDAAAQTLNWPVNGQATSGSSNKVSYNFIIDENTAVSHNAEGLFDLENHQGNVYFIKDNDGKYYARFIEVESYTQTVTDAPQKQNKADTKITVNKTNYNALGAKDGNDLVTWGDVAKGTNGLGAGSTKNTNYTLYFNDDDQIYRVMSDKDFDKESDKVYYVRSVNNNSVRLVGAYAKDVNASAGSPNKTANMSDADTLIWDGSKFIAPSDLEVGDALRQINDGELYVKVADMSGDFTRYTWDNGKATIGGKSYVIPGSKVGADADKQETSITFYDEKLEDSEADLDDVYGNNVHYILNKNNTIAAIIVDETSTGTTLYGIVVGGDSTNATWGSGNTNSITLFNQEGYTITYDFNKDCDYYTMVNGKADNTGDNGDKPTPEKWMGRLVEFKLNSNGEIKEIILVTGAKNSLAFTATDDIEILNNSYLRDSDKNSYALASNVVIFEVGEDGEDFDPSLITRSSLLGGGDFAPEDLEKVELGYGIETGMNAYATFDTNTSGAIKVLAYTTANTSNYHYGVVKSYNFKDADHTKAITLVGDDSVYDLGSGTKSKADAFIVYTLSGDKITPVYSFNNDKYLSQANGAKRVTGYNSGLITVEDGWTNGTDNKAANKTSVNNVYNTSDDTKSWVIENNQTPSNGEKTTTVMTDNNTVVYIINATTGDYEEGSLSDISKNAYIYVPVIDKDGYADIVLVDEYTQYKD